MRRVASQPACGAFVPSASSDLAICAVVASAAQGSGSSAWAKAPSLPAPRSAHALVVAAGAIHVLGGPASSRVDRFDGKHWKREATLPGGALNAPAAVAIGRSLYVVGGFGGVTNAPTAKVRVLDVVSRRWREAAALPGARGGHAAVVLAGRIHVLGGGNASTTLADHSVYDPANDHWSEAPPLPRSEEAQPQSSSAGRSMRSADGAGSRTTGTHSSTTRGPKLVARPEHPAARDGGRSCLARLDLRLRGRVPEDGMRARGRVPARAGRVALAEGEPHADGAELRAERRLRRAHLCRRRKHECGRRPLGERQPGSREFVPSP